MKHRHSGIVKYNRNHGRFVFGLGIAAVIVVGLLTFRLGTSVPGLSPVEQASVQTSYGWHGLLARPFDMPLSLMRSAVYVIAGHQTAGMVRLPNIIFGALTILLFAILIKYWHGNRTALLSTALFACSAWLLHISRLASDDVLYLLAIPLLLIVQLCMLRAVNRPIVFYGSLAVCGALLCVPGLVWCVLLSLFWQRGAIKQGWQRFSLAWQRLVYILVGLMWLPLLVLRLTHATALKSWLGLPTHPAVGQIGRQLAFVPIHLFGRGPQDPQRWLGHAPLLDIFTLVTVLAGIWFYIMHRKAVRTRILGSYLLVGTLLVGLGGSVSLSLLVPVLYILAATGITYLLHDWLVVFPVNPIARNLGISIIFVAVVASCTYNLRAYFVAWPHNPTTVATFNLSANSGRSDSQNLLY